MAARGSAGEPLGTRVDETLDALRAIWTQHRDAAFDRLDVVERAVMELRDGALHEDIRLEAEREAHKLAGSVGIFGFARASEHARALERSFGARDVLGAGRVPRLLELVVGLRQELEEQPAPGGASIGEDEEGGPLLLVVDDDEALLDRIAAEATGRSMRVETALSPAAARESVARQCPDVVLLDLGFPEGQGNALRLLSELSERSPLVPVLVLTVSDGFADRVEVARRGARGFLPKSLRPAEVVDAVAEHLQRLRASETRLLVVDDDPSVLDALRVLLEGDGLALTTLSDPMGVWRALEETAPELLILDIDMPGVDGIDLCRVVRNDPRWAALPIVFLTAHQDAETVQAVFAAGADDYLNKPIRGPELTTRIRNRLDRIRLYRAIADTDALTGVANRRKSVEMLDQLARMATRYEQPLCLAELDIDHFKQVNDRFGHAAGDAVLRRLGELLRRSFRGEDVVARWGGEEFIVGMYGMGREDGVRLVGELLEAFRAQDFGVEGVDVPVTFSAGVAQYPEDGGDPHALYRAADAALYEAKAAGRDRVLAAVPNATPEPWKSFSSSMTRLPGC